MYRLIPAGCVLALGLLMPVLAAQEKAADNPAAKKLNRDIPRHKDFLKRIEQSKGVGDVIFLGDSITHGWEGQKAWQEHFGSFKPVNLGIGGDQTGHVLWRITDGHELDNLKPKAAVIMIGTNNTGGHSRPADRRRHQGHRRGTEAARSRASRFWCWASSRAAAPAMPSGAWNRSPKASSRSTRS